jgi:predicted NUDIX family NTP pyrophosphohydrolase
MAKLSAGLVMIDGRGRVLLVHPGGPFFKKRDAGVWSIPKGLCSPGEEPEAAARREFFEELGFLPPESALHALGSIKQSGNKTVHAWAFSGEWDASKLVSNEFELTWPPGSGQLRRFPEVDRAEFFEAAAASEKIIPAQRPLIERALDWYRDRL